MSRVISASQGEDCRPWDVPELADHAAGVPVAGIRHGDAGTSGRMTAGDLETIERQAREEGFEAGYREGIEAGRQAQAPGIYRISHQRVMQSGHVHPYLVGASGFQFHTQQAMRGEFLLHPVMGDGLFALVTRWKYMHLLAVLGIAADMSHDGSFFLL